MVFFVVVALVAAVVAFWWGGWGGENRSQAKGTPSREADEEWARNFEAASERMEHEIPDPPEPPAP